MPKRLFGPYDGKRYLGNTNEKEVHDLLNEKEACNIDLIKPEHIKMFDSLTTEHNKTFDNCAHCIGGSKH